MKYPMLYNKYDMLAFYATAKRLVNQLRKYSAREKLIIGWLGCVLTKVLMWAFKGSACVLGKIGICSVYNRAAWEFREVIEAFMEEVLYNKEES